ncbi:hypothetical protein OS493_029877 [Desmophyllum pertusum]|uniref:Uncharacterized protein n=1 Tax=Desmophyllum pertusum TaxID=174260 RepID=A0A9W9YA98_9CNID|nr:hypothetical protein OS493_029877 [Desmophyllum pertusum]
MERNESSTGTTSQEQKNESVKRSKESKGNTSNSLDYNSGRCMVERQLHNDSSSQHRIDQLRKYSSQDAEVVFNQQKRRETSFINHSQDFVERDENGGDQNPKSITSAFDFHPIGKSPSSKVRGHHRTSSGQHDMNQLRSCSRAFPNQSSTTKPFIKFDLPSEHYHHSYRGYSCKQANPSSGEKPTAVESFTRHGSALYQQQPHRNCLAPCRSRHYSYCSANALYSHQNLSIHQRNHNKQAARRVNVLRQLKHFPGENESDSKVPEVATGQMTRSTGRMQTSNIASRSQMDGACHN